MSKKIYGYFLMLLFILIIPINVKAANKTEIQKLMAETLYGGSGGRMTCDFDGYTTTSGRHEGIDFSYHKGATIYSLINGEVIRTNIPASKTSTLAIYDEVNNKSVIYLHAAGFKVGVGQRVSKGQAIAIEGTQGTSFAHTHVEVRNGKQGYASYSVGDPVLDNENPYPYWEKIFTPSHSPYGYLDSYSGGEGVINISGWAKDDDEPDAGIEIHVYIGGPAGSAEAEGHSGIYANQYRSDVGNHAYSETIKTNKTGIQDIYIYGINVGGGDNSLIASGTVTIKPNAPNNPYGYLDSYSGGEGVVNISGWAKDDDVPDEGIEIHVYIGGPAGAAGVEGHSGIYANQYRSDVGNHAYSETIKTNKTGVQDIYIYGINVGGGDNSLIASGTVMIKPNAPKVSHISTNGYSYALNENIRFSFTVDGNENSLWVYPPEGGPVEYKAGSNTFYDLSFDKAGLYEALVQTWNSTGNKCSEKIEFLVGPPTAELSINVTKCDNKTNVVLTLGGLYNKESRTLGIYKDGVRIDTVVLTESIYERVYTEPGNYSAYMTAHAGGTYADSDYVYWRVYDKTTAELSIDRDSEMLVGEELTFLFGGDNNSEDDGGYYTLGIYKDGERIRTETVKGDKYTTSFSEPGKYSAYMTAHSNWIDYADSEYVYWEVIAEPTVACISTSEYSYALNQTIEFLFTVDGSENSLWIYSPSGEVVKYKAGSNHYYELSFSNGGVYEALVETKNIAGIKRSEKIEFLVGPPTAELSVNVTKCDNKTNVVLTLGGLYNKESRTLGIYKDGVRIDTVVLTESIYERVYTEPGNYSAYMTAHAGGTYADSDYVYWRVYDKTTAELSIDRDSEMLVGEELTFLFGGDNNSEDDGGYYTLGIYKDGERIRTETVKGDKYTTSFSEPGKYSAYMTAHSNWIDYADSEYVYWEVYEKPSKPIIESIQEGEEIVTLNWSRCMVNTLAYTIRFYREEENEEYVLLDRITTDTVYTYHIPAGKYSVIITAEGNGGWTNSDRSNIFEITSHTHVWNVGVVTTEATCGEKGIKTYTCTKCNTTKIEDIPATGKHEHTEIKNEKDATCVQEGYTGDAYCKDCNMKLSSGETVEKKKHIWDDGTVTIEATCSTTGVMTYTCSGCQITKTEELPVTENHKYTDIRGAKEATCVEKGYTGDTYCTDCGTKLSTGEELVKTEHSWNTGELTKSSTCTEAGTKTYTCTACETTRTEEIPAKGHETTVTKFAKEATCTSDGYTGDVFCQNCENLLEEGTVILALGHSWNEGEVTKAPTCTADGIETYTCSKCQGTKTETISATGHRTTEIRNTKEATCTEEGYTGDTYCKDCDTKLTSGDAISKVSHTWNAGEVTKAPTCTEDGIKTYTCSNCRETKTEKISATGHVWDNGRITTQPTASRNGIRTYTCQKCKATKTETINATGLKVGSTIKDTKSNGYYKVTDKKGLVSFVKPINTKKSSVTIPDTINYQGITCRVTAIGNNAFKGNKYLVKLKIGKYVTTIGSSSFYGCVKLPGLTLGNNTVNIGNYAFAKCTVLSKATIPSKVTTIGKQAFYGCKKLKSITIKTNKLTTKTVGSNCFKGIYAKPTIAVPNAKYSYYKKLLYARGVSSKAVFKKF